MHLKDLVKEFTKRKCKPKELAEQFVRLTLISSFEEMGVFRLELAFARPLNGNAAKAFDQYLLVVTTIAKADPQYLKKLEGFAQFVENKWVAKDGERHMLTWEDMWKFHHDS